MSDKARGSVEFDPIVANTIANAALDWMIERNRVPSSPQRIFIDAEEKLSGFVIDAVGYDEFSRLTYFPEEIER